MRLLFYQRSGFREDAKPFVSVHGRELSVSLESTSPYHSSVEALGPPDLKNGYSWIMIFYGSLFMCVC